MGKFNWMLALVVSVIFHVIVVGAWVAIGRATPDAPAPSEETPPAAATNEAPASPSSPVGTNDGAQSQTVPPAASDTAAPKKPAKPQAEAKKPSDRTKPSAAAKPAAAKKKPIAAPETEAAGQETEIYVTKKGDSLTKIAEAHGITLKELKALNKVSLSKTHNLWVGQKLKVPKKSN